jgi:hypothetical protein
MRQIQSKLAERRWCNKELQTSRVQTINIAANKPKVPVSISVLKAKKPSKL